MSNEKHPSSERFPRPIIPTEPPPPPAVPDEEAPDTEPKTPATQRLASPAHAPSRRAAGRAVIQRKESPPEGTPKIIDRARGSARAQAGTAIYGSGFTGTAVIS
jgi:hypothetical protein